MQSMQKPLKFVVFLCIIAPLPCFYNRSSFFANAISPAVSNILVLHVLLSVTVRELQEHVAMIMSS